MVDEDALRALRLEADHTNAYGGHPEQVVDFLFPKGSTAGDGKTMVVLFHGGYWRPAWDRHHTAPLATALAAEGFLVAVPEYRRVTGWPEIFDDVAVLTEALPMMTAAQGLRPTRVVYMGHSAGGHLALWAAARRRLPAGSAWRSEAHPDVVVSLAGCASLRLTDEWTLGDGAARAMMHGTVDGLAARYADCDPAALLPLGIPVTLVHGSDDDVVPPTMSRAYAHQATEAGDEIQLVELEGLDHFDVIDPESPVWPHLLTAIGG